MLNAAIDIPNLLYRYADAMDAADFAGAAAMFDNGHVVMGDQKVRGVHNIAAIWQNIVKVHSDGTLRTRHITTNPIITLSRGEETAECQSQWTVFQATDNLPLQIVASGRYHDQFAIINKRWEFIERKYAQVDLIGNTDEHLFQPLGKEKRS